MKSEQQQNDGVADWYSIARLISQRWPQWEPNDQEKADWRRAIGYREFDLIDEAMLQTKMKYSSAIPQMKWILAEFYKLKDAKYEQKKEETRVESKRGADIDMKDVNKDREDCLSFLMRQSVERLKDGAEAVRNQYGSMLPMSVSPTPNRWGWAMRFAVMLKLQEDIE